MPEKATPAGFLLCDRFTVLSARALSRPSGRNIQCHIFLYAQYFEFGRFSLGRESKFHFIYDPQFFKGSRHCSIYAAQKQEKKR
jgi:hypothetical protein